MVAAQESPSANQRHSNVDLQFRPGPIRGKHWELQSLPEGKTSAVGEGQSQAPRASVHASNSHGVGDGQVNDSQPSKRALTLKVVHHNVRLGASLA